MSNTYILIFIPITDYSSEIKNALPISNISYLLYYKLNIYKCFVLFLFRQVFSKNLSLFFFKLD